MSTSAINPQEQFWPFWPLLPIYPYGRRQTLRLEVIKDTIWTFEQVQGILYVIVPVRMTVIKLIGGGLLLYGAIAPTPECIRLLQELVSQHGEVKYIIHPTASGLEHKVFVGPLSRHFPNATIFVIPGQWSFPLNLPLSWLGFPPQRTRILPPDPQDTPFGDQFDYKILGPSSIGWGTFAEVAFFHKLSRTLLVTDTLISLTEEPPLLLRQNPYSLLFHAREQAGDALEDTALNRSKGWQRTCLLALYFQPAVLGMEPLTKTIKNAFWAPERSARSYWGLFPFQWHPDWQKSFSALSNQGRLFVAPILQTLILNRLSAATLDWVEQVCRWDIGRVIPSHFHAPKIANSSQVHQAFAFLKASPSSCLGEDFSSLEKLEKILMKGGILIPRQ